MSSRLVLSNLSRHGVRQAFLRGMTTQQPSVTTMVASGSRSNLLTQYLRPVTATPVRFFSDNSKATEKEEAAAPEPKEEEEAESSEGGENEESKLSPEEEKIAELEQQVKDIKDQLLRSLAEQENTRRIAKRDVDSAKNFAVTSFAKSLLDTSDNLSRALEAVPEEFRADKENHAVLATLYEGIQMTDAGLTKAFVKNGLVKYGDAGEVFDPNKHEALFEYPDPNGTPGTVGQVMKMGFTLNDRVIRPAEVGVIKKV